MKRWWMAGPAAALLACGSTVGGPAAPPVDRVDPEDADVTVLFLGNSLTYTNDLPAMTAAVARAAGLELAYATIAAPNASLEDHWRAGVDAQIRDFAADYVVLQQGPSSLPQNQLHLLEWTRRLDRSITEAGGRSALFMVWPSSDRLHAFDDVRDAYHDAAAAVDGVFIPAGEAWRAAWRRDAGLGLYGPDGFHPSPLGTLAAAITVLCALADIDPVMLPAEPAVLAPLLPAGSVSATTLRLLLESVREALQQAAAPAG